jgi:hypothetical protein
MMASLCYIATLWPEDDKELRKLERLMIKYLWARQKVSAAPKVLEKILFKTVQEGGIGLISLKTQVHCLRAK